MELEDWDGGSRQLVRAVGRDEPLMGDLHVAFDSRDPSRTDERCGIRDPSWRKALGLLHDDEVGWAARRAARSVGHESSSELAGVGREVEHELPIVRIAKTAQKMMPGRNRPGRTSLNTFSHSGSGS